MRIASFLLFLLFSSILPGFCQTGFSILLEKTETEMVYLFKVPFAEILAKNSQVSREGFELIDLEIYNDECWGVWKKTENPVKIEWTDSWEAFEALKDTRKEEGLLLNDIEIVQHADGSLQIIGLWQDKKNDYDYWILPDLKNIKFHYKSLAKIGLYLKDIETIQEPSGLLKYVALYHRGTAREMAHLTQFGSEVAFDEDKTKRILSGYACQDIETPLLLENPIFLALYKKSDHTQYISYQMSWESLLNFQNHIGPAYKIMDIELNNSISRTYLAPYNIARMDDTPDSDMKEIHQDYNRTDKAIQNQSIAFATANALFWISNNGYQKLNTTGTAIPTRACLKMAKTLANKDYMKTMIPGESSIYTIIHGLHKFISAAYTIEKIKYFSIETFNRGKLKEDKVENKVEVHDNLDNIPLEEAKKNFDSNSIMLVKWGLYQPSENSLNLKKKGEVWGTLVGYGLDLEGHKAPKTIIVHDPSDGNKSTQKYFSVRSLDNYHLTGKSTQLVMPQPYWEPLPQKVTQISTLKKQYLYLENEEGRNPEWNNNSVQTEKAFAIWESFIVVKLDELSKTAKASTIRN